jgi:hypothetical protein
MKGLCFDIGHLLTLEKDIQKQMFLNNLQILDVPHNAALGFRGNEVFNDRIEPFVLLQVILDGFILHNAKNTHNAFVLFGSNEHLDDGGHVQIVEFE